MKNLALLIVAVVAGMLLSEGVMRVAGFKPRTVNINRFFIPGETSWSVPDPDLGWINKPGTSRSIEEGEVQMTFWDNGRRATRPDPTPPAAGIPVMIIGGSNAQSYGVRDEETFPYLLGQRYPQLAIENFGNGGYGTAQSLMLAERAYRDFYKDRKPRLILLAFDDAHIQRNVADQSWIFAISDSEGRYIAPPHYRLENGKLVFHPFKTIGFWPLESRSAALTVLHNVWLQSFAYNTAAQAMPVTRELIARTQAFARANDALFAVVVLEDRTQITPGLFRDADFPHVDCSALGRSDPKAYFLGGNSHPNRSLHAHFADCIGTWLETEILPKLDQAP
ncbi:MAG: hypothetical protein ACYCZX_01930 [Rhodospirillaceae bacterium]